MRRLTTLCLTLTVLIVGCATPSEEADQSPDEPVGQVPEETDETPVWVKSASKTKPREGTDAGQTGADPESTPPARRRPTGEPERQPVRAVPDTLEGVFPDERITLDFKQAKISRVMRLFQVKADLNIVLTPEVDGRMTVSTEDALLEEAFRTVLQTAGLTFDRRTDALVVSPE
jgi:hypothetical protein